MKNRTVVALIAIFLLLTFWQAASGIASSFPDIRPGIQLDRQRLSAQIQKLIFSDLQTLHQLQLGAVDNNFRLFFHGATSQDIERYLLERVHYVGLDLDEKTHKPDPTTYASNFAPGFLSWYYHAYILHERNAKPDTMAWQQFSINLTSPRIGFIGIGGAYLDPKTSQIDRIDTWVHEARHSDCPRIPSAQDLALIDREDYLHTSFTGRACSNLHMPCPAGHPLAGKLACDDHPWGAYTAGYIFAKNVAKACTNCTELQKQNGLASATDDYSRLSTRVQNFLNNASPTPPDMTSFDARSTSR